MSRGGRLWRGLLVAILAVAVAGCERVQSTTNYKVTIRVDGRDYTSDVVGQILFDVVGDRSKSGPYGRVMTFRLPDDRVVVLGTFTWQSRLQCVPRLDQTHTECPNRWVNSRMHLSPDGYVFNSATNPTSVEVFQFEPRDPEFTAKGRYDLLRLRQGPLSVPLSDLVIEMVSYAESEPWVRRPRDTLERDFPGYDLTHNRDGKPVSETNRALSVAANDVLIPLARDR